MALAALLPPSPVPACPDEQKGHMRPARRRMLVCRNQRKRGDLSSGLGLKEVFLGSLAPVYLRVEVYSNCKTRPNALLPAATRQALAQAIGACRKGCVQAGACATACAAACADCLLQPGAVVCRARRRKTVHTYIRTFLVLGRSRVEKINLDDGPGRVFRPLFKRASPGQARAFVAQASAPAVPIASLLVLAHISASTQQCGAALGRAAAANTHVSPALALTLGWKKETRRSLPSRAHSASGCSSCHPL